MIIIREATVQDSNNIHDVYLRAFNRGEAKIVASLASNLLSEETTSKIIALIAEIDGTVAGHIAFSPVTFEPDNKLTGYILAPLGVTPKYHFRGIGSKLIKSGIEQLLSKGVNILFVYGDPKYHNKFGFNTKTASKFLPPYTLQYPFGWLAVIINEENFSDEPMKISCVNSLQDSTLW